MLEVRTPMRSFGLGQGRARPRPCSSDWRGCCRCTHAWRWRATNTPRCSPGSSAQLGLRDTAAA
ncbi:MAG: hypothetical protein U0168_04255 [Nannocystaceae bacterium]